MNNTKKILNDIKSALDNGQLTPNELPVKDLINCVYLEIETAKMSFTAEQFNSVLTHFKSFTSHFEEGTLDMLQAELFMDGLLLSYNTISESVHSLVSGDYWRLKYAEKLDDPEITEIISYIDKHRRLQLINYGFMSDYETLPCQSGFDAKCGMVYVIHKGKRMYFPRSYSEASAVEYYRTICGEQDPRSPHCYEQPGFQVQKGDVIVDCGGAEGIFSLEHLNEASEIYIFDAAMSWIEALQETFKDYSDKVHIIYGFVGATSDGKENIALDDILKDKEINYIKMDIEGAERYALTGAKELILRSQKLRCAICSYHLKDDEAWISNFFDELKMEHTTSKGYMFPDWCNNSIIEAPLRRGVVFGKSNR